MMLTPSLLAGDGLAIGCESTSGQFRWNILLNKTSDSVEKMGIDPITSRMLNERSTIWATSPLWGVEDLQI